MALEQEVKLEVTSKDALDLTLLASLLSDSGVVFKQDRLISRYFDSADLVILKQGLGLRRRFDGENWYQTVKETGQANHGLHQRQEWECRLKADAFDRWQLKQTPLRTILEDEVVWAGIRAIFNTDFIRHSASIVMKDGTTIEVAYDVGRVYIDEFQNPIHELELELKLGSVEQLSYLAEHLSARLPLQYSDISKAQRGYRLVEKARSLAR